jgi:hypothetical protein
MPKFKIISTIQALATIQNGEFSEEIKQSKKSVAIVLTQSWCPQWSRIKRGLEQLTDPNLDIWVFIYDQTEIFDQFLQFKENVFGNDEIPYIRYYHEGHLITTSNAVDLEEFLQFLKGDIQL